MSIVFAATNATPQSITAIPNNMSLTDFMIPPSYHTERMNEKIFRLGAPPMACQYHYTTKRGIVNSFTKNYFAQGGTPGCLRWHGAGALS